MHDDTTRQPKPTAPREPSADPTPAAPTPAAPLPVGGSRRDFMTGVGKKALYITPVLLTLSAAQAIASPHAASCKTLGGSCSTNSDCCSNSCDTGICI